MARLTWQDVAAPNFSGAMDGVESASRLINSAIGQAQSGVRDYQKIQDDQLNSRLMVALAGMDSVGDASTIPDLLKNAGDPSRIRSDVFSLAMGRKGQLTQQELGDINLRDTRTTSDRNNQYLTALDGAAPELTAFNAAVNANDPKAIAAARAAVAAKMGNAPAEKLLSLYSSLQGQESGALGVVGSRQRIGFDAENQGWTREDRVLDTQADTISGQIQMGGALTQDDYEAAARGMGLDGRTFTAVMQRAPQFQDFGSYGTGPDLSGLGGGGSGGSGGPVTFGAPQMAVASTLKQSGLSDAVVAGFMGNFQVEGGYTGAQGDGGTAGGIAQWRGDRRANFVRVIGVDPTKASPDQQAKFVLWELNNPKSGAFVPKDGLTPEQQVAAIKNAKSPGEAAQLIDRFYERSDGKARGSRVAAASAVSSLIAQAAGKAVDNAQRGSAFIEQNAGDSLALKFSELAGRTGESPAQVARQIVKENPDAKLNVGWVESQIIKLMSDVASAGGSRKKINAAMAGQAILDNSGSQGAREFWGRLVPDAFASNTIGEDQVVDYDAAKNALVGYATGRMDDKISTNAALAETAQAQAAAQAQADAARARIQAKIRAAQAKGIRNPNLAVEMADLAAAEAQLADAGNQPSGGLPGYDAARQQAAEVEAQRLIQAQRAQAAQKAAANRARQAPPPPAPRKNSAEARRGRAAEMLKDFALSPIYALDALLTRQ